jgi:macrolide transport system ATP-binding/permease protein
MRRFLLKLLRRRRLHTDLDAELAFHRDMAAAGGNPIPIGNSTVLREHALDLWRFNLLEDLWRDVFYALRAFRRTPTITAAALLSLGLGIGANTAIFSVVNTYLLRPMPVDDPDNLVAIYLTSPHRGNGDLISLSYPDLLDYRKQSTGLTDIMGSTGIGLSVTDNRTPELIWGEVVTGNYFSGLGVHPILGRGFLPEEDRVPGRNAVCVLNYHYWLRRYQGDRSAVGKTIRISGHPFTIVGVAPHGFIGTTLFQFVPDVWVPVMMQQTIAPSEGNYLEGRGNGWINPRARLKPGVTRRQAETALNVIAGQLAREYPKTNAGLEVHVIPGGSRVQPSLVAMGLVSKTTGLLAGVVILVLLIACANVANLLLARGQARAREMAIRVSIGAGRSRLIRQMLTESLVLSLLGGALGIVLAVGFGRLLSSFYPSLDFQTTDMDYEMQFDPRLLPFTIAISTAAALLFGLVPALRASRIDQVTAMKGGAPPSTSGQERFARGNLLVLAQVCLSSVLLIFGGLFLRSMQYSSTVDVGFDRSGILMFSLDLDLQGYKPDQGRMFQRTLLERLRALPGVENASLGGPLPLDAYDSSIAVLPEGYVPRSDRERNFAGLSRVGPGYFATMGTHIVAGRPIDARDTPSAPAVAVINETMARRYWQTPERALGRRFRRRAEDAPIEVVGVARDGKYTLIGEPATPYCFVPLEQDYQGHVTALVRSTAPVQTLIPEIRAQVASIEPNLPIFGVRTVPEFLTRILSVYQMGATLLGTFGATALLLAASGIFGVVHFAVVRRTREIGLRVALGASRSQVLRLVLESSLIFVGAGILLGAGLALAASSLTGDLVAGVRGSDPLAFAGAILLLVPLAAVAVLLPARAALRVDPITALREE